MLSKCPHKAPHTQCDMLKLARWIQTVQKNLFCVFQQLTILPSKGLVTGLVCERVYLVRVVNHQKVKITAIQHSGSKKGSFHG